MADSESTRGGCSFDQLCQGPFAAYCCDNLVDIRGLSQLEQTKGIIVPKIIDIITSLQIGRGQRVAKMYIGKTYIHRRKTPGGHFQDLDPMNSKTWKLEGISDRWRDHKSKDYGKDGMVILAAVTDKALPPKCRVNREKYALAIEQCLLHHFLINIGDQRVVNDGFSTGKVDDGKSIAYVIYMAFAFEEAAQQEPSQAGFSQASSGSSQLNQSPILPAFQTDLHFWHT